MFAISAVLDINPPGISPVLSREQMWQGLVMKAENALPFVPAMQSCEVIERLDDGFIREIVLRGVRMRERIILTAPVEVRFIRLDTPYDGWITNVLHDGPRGLALSFSFAMRFPGASDGSPAERAEGQAVKDSYLGAIASTVDATRRMVSEGVITAEAVA
jgi:hypothetical protein